MNFCQFVFIYEDFPPSCSRKRHFSLFTSQVQQSTVHSWMLSVIIRSSPYDVYFYFQILIVLWCQKCLTKNQKMLHTYIKNFITLY